MSRWWANRKKRTLGHQQRKHADVRIAQEHCVPHHRGSRFVGRRCWRHQVRAATRYPQLVSCSRHKFHVQSSVEMTCKDSLVMIRRCGAHHVSCSCYPNGFVQNSELKSGNLLLPGSGYSCYCDRCLHLLERGRVDPLCLLAQSHERVWCGTHGLHLSASPVMPPWHDRCARGVQLGASAGRCAQNLLVIRESRLLR